MPRARLLLFALPKRHAELFARIENAAAVACSVARFSYVLLAQNWLRGSPLLQASSWVSVFGNKAGGAWSYLLSPTPHCNFAAWSSRWGQQFDTTHPDEDIRLSVPVPVSMATGRPLSSVAALQLQSVYRAERTHESISWCLLLH